METVKFPDKLRFLFEPYRYKVAHGGRGSAKSWSFARALLLQGTTKRLRILCAREVQKSIKQSVHKLLKDQIELLDLGAFYEVLETEIRGVSGTEIAFAGLSSLTVESIKSFEGVDIVWVEEGQSVSKRSWEILIPTIRKDASEIWVSLNPELDTDDTYQRFVANPPPGACVAQVNYHDNPWFPDVLEKERRHAQVTMLAADYEHIWEGKCKPAVEGAIYFQEISDAQSDGRVCNVPYDPMLKVHVVMDLGWNDAMAISLVQRHASEMRLIEYLEDSHRTLADYSADLRTRRMNWGKLYLPHDGRNKDFKSGKSAQEIMEDLGWEVEITPNMSVEDGIRLTRMMMPRLYIDKTKAAGMVECVRRYRRQINQQTNEPGAPLHDEWSHGADCLRYVAVNAETMRNEDWGGDWTGKLKYKKLTRA